MAKKRVNVSIIQRHDTAENFESKNPVLENGEKITVITEEGVRHKTGDGTKSYTELPFDDENLYQAIAGKCDASRAVEVTLVGTEWQDGQQTVTVEGLKEGQNGIATLPQSLTDAQYEAVVAAEMRVTAQGENSITISCNADAPQIDIPVVVILLG